MLSQVKASKLHCMLSLTWENGLCMLSIICIDMVLWCTTKLIRWRQTNNQLLKFKSGFLSLKYLIHDFFWHVVICEQQQPEHLTLKLNWNLNFSARGALAASTGPVEQVGGISNFMCCVPVAVHARAMDAPVKRILYVTMNQPVLKLDENVVLNLEWPSSFELFWYCLTPLL